MEELLERRNQTVFLKCERRFQGKCFAEGREKKKRERWSEEERGKEAARRFECDVEKEWAMRNVNYRTK